MTRHLRYDRAVLPKRGSRVLTIGGRRYRWTVHPAEYPRAFHHVIAQPEDGGEQMFAFVAGANFVTPRLVSRLIDRASRLGQREITIAGLVALRGASELDEVVAALRADEHQRALAAALDSWRRSHITALADAIDRISEALRARPPADERTYDDAAWRAALAEDQPLLPEVIDLLFSPDPDVTAERALLLSRARPDDPRIARRLLEGLTRPVHPYGPRARPLLEVALEILGNSGDHRVLDGLRGEGGTALAQHAVGMRHWVWTELERAVQRLERGFPLGEPYLVDAEPMLEAIQVQLGLTPPEAPPGAPDLLAALQTDPSDDNLRRVYADLLLDADDPRGEMIHLQLEPELSEEAKARLAHLLELHSERWLGSLRGWLERVQFERGFPARGRLTWRALSEDGDADDPSWATVEELALPFRNVDTDPFLARLHRLVSSPVMRSLRAIREASVEVVEVLAAIDDLRIERVHLAPLTLVDGHTDATNRLLAAFERGFVHLASLELTGTWPEDAVVQLRRALAKRAELKVELRAT